MARVYWGQKGYRGCSMSNRAYEAYENGEKPISKWTKAAIIETAEGIYSNRVIELMKKCKLTQLKGYFIYPSSQHHTGKYATLTTFYSIGEYDEDEVITALLDMLK